MCKKIQINYQEPYYNVVLGEDDVIGHSITSFFEAYDLAKEYQRSNKELEIVVPEDVNNLIDIYQEFRVMAENIGLPSEAFQGLADKLLQYKEEHKHEKRSFESFMIWLRNRNQSNYIH